MKEVKEREVLMMAHMFLDEVKTMEAHQIWARQTADTNLFLQNKRQHFFKVLSSSKIVCII